MTAPADPEKGEAEPVRDRLRRAYSEHARRTAIVTERRISTFRDLEDRVSRLARTFRDLGCRAGGTVGFVLTPRPEDLCEMRLAAYETAATLFVIPPNLDPESMAEMVNSVAPRAVFYDSRHLPDFPRVLRAAAPSSRAIPIGGERDAPALSDERPTETVDDSPDPGGLSSIGFTSGTTGVPKGVTATHAALAASAGMMLEVLSRLGARPGEALYNAIPMFAAGAGLLVPALCAGLAQHLPDRWDPARALARIERFGIAWSFLTPSEILDLLDQPLERCNLDSLRGIFYGTAPMPAARLEEAVRRFPARFLQGYGTSECLPPVTLLWPEDHGTRENPATRHVLGSAGRPYPGVAVRIDGEGGGPGEILISSATVMTGYWKDPVKTASCLDGGWFRSGDLGFFDDEGRLHVIDRKHDVLVRSGTSIFPRRIEEVASEHPIVKEVSVVSTGASGRIVAVISLRPPYRKDPEAARRALRDWLDSRLSREEVPDDVRIWEELPRSMQGKVLKREVRHLLGIR